MNDYITSATQELKWSGVIVIVTQVEQPRYAKYPAYRYKLVELRIPLYQTIDSVG